MKVPAPRPQPVSTPPTAPSRATQDADHVRATFAALVKGAPPPQSATTSAVSPNPQPEPTRPGRVVDIRV